MKNFPNNQQCFKFSLLNKEPTLDNFYIFEEKHKNLDLYVNNTKIIKNYLITIKTLINNKEKTETINTYLEKLSKALNKYSNCSEFSCFINACDSVLGHVKKDDKLLKEITLKYLEKRDLNENAPSEWIQAILDTNSSRKKGRCGENKLLFFLDNVGYVRVFDWEGFENQKRCVALFSKSFSIKNVRKNLNIKINTKKQNKNLDLIIKNDKHIFLLEAKHLNTSGGGQDKQISELIEIISLSEKDKNIHYVSFLDGYYSNFLLSEERVGPKISQQRKEIKKFLQLNKNNYWLNTVGFKKLFGLIN